MSEPICRPEEIPPSVSLIALAGAQYRHAMALLDHRHGLAVLVDAERAGHALSVLAYSAALVERVLGGRWLYAVEALDAGAGREQVAAALGLAVDELATGLRSWAAGQHRHGLIDAERRDQVLALLGDEPDGQGSGG